MTTEDDKVKIKVLQGNGTPDAILEALRRTRKNFDYMKEVIELNAELQLHKYKSLKKAGFTDAEALELCKQIF